MQPLTGHLSHSVTLRYSSVQFLKAQEPYSSIPASSTRVRFNGCPLQHYGTNEVFLGRCLLLGRRDPFLTPFPIDFRDRRVASERTYVFLGEPLICLIQMDLRHKLWFVLSWD